MVSQYGIKYAVHIITNHFGNLVAKVCECLLRKGPLSFQSVVKHTELAQDQVKNCLLVLIQHNCVQAFIIEEPGGVREPSRFTTKYMVLFDNVLHRMRFPKFLAIVPQEFGKLCIELLTGLLQHGRLTLKQMHDKANDGNSVGLNVVKENLHKLLMAHFVECCPASEPVLALPTEEEASGAKKGPKRAKIIVESETLEQRVLAAAVPMDAKRFSVVINTELDVDGERNNNNNPSEHVGEKRKHAALESNIDCGNTDDHVVLWRANFEEFIRRLRHKACVDNVRARLDDGAAIVFSAMLDASRSDEKKVKTENSVPLSVNSIYEEVIKSEKGRNMTFDHVRAALVQLSSPPPFVMAVDESYSIDFKHIIEAAQGNEVELIVSKRYGGDACKIFRHLSRVGHLLETDKISDAAFVEKKETAKLLYKLWQDDYLLMEKLAAGAMQFLLWKVNKKTLWEHVLDEMFHAALNLSLRLAYELEQQHEILNLPLDKRVGPLKGKYDRLTKVRVLLGSSQMKLDDAIMLFHDF